MTSVDTLLVVAGSLIAASGTVPYIIATVRHQTKPRIVTWLTWALLTGLASAAAFSDHQIGGGIFALLGALSCASVVAVGLRYGDRSFAKLDIICMAGVVLGLMLWMLLSDPAIGVWAAVAIDFVGLVPTIKHAWKAPQEETPVTYALVGVGGALTVAAVLTSQAVTVTSVGYPLYAGISLGLLAIMIVARRRTLSMPVRRVR